MYHVYEKVISTGNTSRQLAEPGIGAVNEYAFTIAGEQHAAVFRLFAWILAGEDCDFVTAVIVIDAENTGRWADKSKITYTTFGDLSQKPEVYRLIEQEIALVNEGLPTSQRIKKYVNLHKEFDPDESELTRDRKLRRSVLAERYVALTRKLAGDDTSVEVEAEFTYQDGRTARITTALQIATVERGD